MITCKNCHQALHHYLDRELSEDDVLQVNAHLGTCTTCDHLYRFEVSVRRVVRVRAQEQRAPDALRAKILARLTAECARRDARAL